MKPLLPAVTALAAIGMLALPTQNAKATVTTHPHIVLGVNRGNETQFFDSVPGARAVRIYYDHPNIFPASWPVRAGKGVWSLLSIRPTPWMLLHHRLDTELEAMISSAPPHSELTIWHENAVGNNPLSYPSDVHNANTYVRMQEYTQQLVKGSQVRFGIIVCGPAMQVENWLAPHLDWYGYDFYDNRRYWNRDGTLSEVKEQARMTANLAAFRQVSGERYPAIRIGETNSAWDNHRRNWFGWQAAWFATHDGNRPAWMLTYWNSSHGKDSGGLSGPWPPSLPVIRRLRYIAKEYR